jgi:hypothetical protein
MEVSGLSVVSATAVTFIQIVAATNHPISILGWGMSFNGIVATDDPIGVQLLIQTTAGTATGSTTIRSRVRTESVTYDTTGKVGAYSAEPTASDQFPMRMVHPQSGFEIWLPEKREIIIAAGNRIGLRAVPGTLNATLDPGAAFLDFEE